MNFKRSSVLIAAILSLACALAFADDDNHGTDHSKGHSNDKTQCKKPPKGGNGDHDKDHGGDKDKGGNGGGKGGNGGNGGNGGRGGSSSSNNTNTNNNTNNLSNTQSQNQSQSQSATATSTASVSDSGNSSSSSAASNNGNGNGNGSNNTTFQAPKIPVSTAYAPNAYPTVPCFKGVSGGVQTMAVGVSGSGGKIDAGCDAREEARVYALLGARTAACKVMVFDKKNQKLAKKHPEQAVTMDDCMYEPPAPPVVEAPAPPAPVQIILPANTPIAAVAPAPTPVVAEQLIGICTFSKVVSCKPEKGITVISPTSVCKQQLEAAKLALERNPNSVLLIRGNRNQSEVRSVAVTRANNVQRQLIQYGVQADRLKVEAGNGTARTVELVLVPQN